MLIGQFAALTALIWWFGLSLADIPDVASNGEAIILIVCVSTPVQVLVLVVMARPTGASATDYLALKLPRRVEVVVGVITIMIFVAASDGISWLLGRDIVSQFQLDTYRSASTTGYLPWLWLTLVVMAPIGDVWPVITVIALIWTVSHLQYDLFFMAQIFVSGLLLGWFRWISESTILSMLLHGLLNFEATLKTVIAFQH
jgi:membrane protease YdiL (CAAX protease family)